MSHQMDAAWHRLMAVLYSDLDSFSLKQRFLAELRKAVPFDAAFVAGADPVTNLFTSSYTEEIPASEAMRFLHNELAEADVNKFRELSEERVPVAHLDRATQGERLASPRYREIMRPIGFGDELRAALHVSSMTWGYLCLHREDVPTGFTEASRIHSEGRAAYGRSAPAGDSDGASSGRVDDGRSRSVSDNRRLVGHLQHSVGRSDAGRARRN
jgi:hypothetical protein